MSGDDSASVSDLAALANPALYADGIPTRIAALASDAAYQAAFEQTPIGGALSHQIADEGVWVGAQGAAGVLPAFEDSPAERARILDELRARRISVIVCCCADDDDPDARVFARDGIEYVCALLSDGAPAEMARGATAFLSLVERAWPLVAAALSRGDRVLVHCNSGMHRSASVAMALLMVLRGEEGAPGLACVFADVVQRRAVMRPTYWPVLESPAFAALARRLRGDHSTSTFCVSVVSMTGAIITIDGASAADTIRSVKERVFAANRELHVRRQRLMYRAGPHSLEPLADDETLGGAGVARDDSAELDIMLVDLTEAEVAELGPDLIQAAEVGRLGTVGELLDEGVNIDFANWNGMTALMCAAQNGQNDCVRLLLDAGSDLEIRNQINNTALNLAAFNGRTDCVRQLVDAGADVEAKNVFGFTALVCAAEQGYAACLRLLLDAGANKEVKVELHSTSLSDQSTALIFAAKDGYVDCVRLLVGAGADTEAKNERGYTALVCAAAEGHADCVLILIDAGANKEAKNKNGDTALVLAVQNGHADCAQLLSSATFRISVVSMTGAAITIDDAAAADTIQSVKERVFAVNRKLPAHRQRLMYRAGQHGIIPLADDETLGGAGVAQDGAAELDVLLQDLTKEDADDLGLNLLEAAEDGRLDEVCVLLDEGANIDFAGANGMTALMLAAENDHADCARLLLDAGANKEAADENERTALESASHAGHADLVQMLLDAGADVRDKVRGGCSALILAAIGGHATCARLLLDAGADKEATSGRGETALVVAASRGHANYVQLLIDAGASMENKNCVECTALILAVRRGRADCVRLLINAGVNTEAKNGYGSTALHEAAFHGNADCTRLLLDAGADQEAKNGRGESALMLASRLGHAACARMLMEAGASKNGQY